MEDTVTLPSLAFGSWLPAGRTAGPVALQTLMREAPAHTAPSQRGGWEEKHPTTILPNMVGVMRPTQGKVQLLFWLNEHTNEKFSGKEFTPAKFQV